LPARTQARFEAFVSDAYLTCGHIGSFRLRVHVTSLFGLLFLVSGRPELLAALFLVILVHEYGHAVLVRRFGARVLSIDIGPLGGLCRFSDTLQDLERAWVAWGGVAAQGALQLLIVGASFAPVSVPWLGELSAMNIVVALLNLLPIPPLDGALAWTVPMLLWRRARASKPRPKLAKAKKRASHLRVVDDAFEDARREGWKRSQRERSDSGDR
jgi:Zn-dependent protease